jgi:glycosyltransferase involved in cell wall biosynthesis
LRRIIAYPPSSFQRYAPNVLGKCLEQLVEQERDIDVIVLDTQLMGQIVLYHSISKPYVMALADIQQVQLRRALSTIGWRPLKFVYFLEWLKTGAYERRMLRHHDHIVVVSSEDEKFVRQHCPQADIAFIPNGVDTEYFAPAKLQPDHTTLLFVGGYEYSPNVDAFHYFYQEIFPLVRLYRPDIRFLAVGRNPPESIKAISVRDSQVTVTGTVDDVRPYYAQSTLAVVPLRIGGGTKLKLLEAFAMGVPVVATSVGCEGIEARDGEHVAIADTPITFAESVMRLIDHRFEAHSMAERARTLVASCYEWGSLSSEFERYLIKMIERQTKEISPTELAEP